VQHLAAAFGERNMLTTVTLWGEEFGEKSWGKRKNARGIQKISLELGEEGLGG